MKELTERGLRLSHARALAEKFHLSNPVPKGIVKAVSKDVQAKVVPKKLVINKINFQVGGSGTQLEAAMTELFQKRQR